jgi:hypothetical protein
MRNLHFFVVVDPGENNLRDLGIWEGFVSIKRISMPYLYKDLM